MDKFKEGFKKAGYATVGVGAVVYEKGKEIYENIAPKINKMAEKGEKVASKVANNISDTFDELVKKGKKVCSKDEHTDEEAVTGDIIDK